MRSLRRQAFLQQCLLFVMSCQWIAEIGARRISAMEPPLQMGDSPQTAVDENSRLGYLGIEPIDVGTATANALGVKSPNGTVVRNVLPKSPADVAGLKAGDVILSLGGHETGDIAAFQKVMTRSKPGQEVVLDVRRVDSLMNFKVRLSRMPLRVQAPVAPDDSDQKENSPIVKCEAELPAIGIRVVSAGTAATGDLGIETPIGGVIADVHPDTPGAAAGLRVADLVQRFDDHKIETYEDFEAAMMNSQPGSRVPIVFVRGTTRIKADVVLGQRTGEVQIYTHPTNAFQIRFSSSWKHEATTTQSGKAVDRFRSWDSHYTLDCLAEVRKAPSADDALDAFIGRNLQKERGKVTRLRSVAFISREIGAEQRRLLYLIGVVVKENLCEFRVEAPILSDPEKLPFPIESLMIPFVPELRTPQ